MSREEAEEISFVPSAISIPRGPLFWCDDRCSDEALRFWQFASVVVDDGDKVHAVKLCQQCYNEGLMAQGLALLENWQWTAVVERKTHLGRLCRMLGKDQYIQGMWEYLSLEISESEKVAGRMPSKKSRKGCKASGNESLLPKNIWNK